MRALYWSGVAIVFVVVADALGCGGRLESADCGQGREYCSAANVCCPAFTTCGDGTNGCPMGDCCLSTSSHIVDGGGDGESDALSPTQLPPPTTGSQGPTNASPGGLPGNGGGGGGGGGSSTGGHRRS